MYSSLSELQFAHGKQLVAMGSSDEDEMTEGEKKLKEVMKKFREKERKTEAEEHRAALIEWKVKINEETGRQIDKSKEKTFILPETLGSWITENEYLLTPADPTAYQRRAWHNPAFRKCLPSIFNCYIVNEMRLPGIPKGVTLIWSNLKSLSIVHMQTDTLQTLVQTAVALEVLDIILLESRLKKNKEAEMNSATLKSLAIRTFEGPGTIRLVTPKLTFFKWEGDRAFSPNIKLAFPENLRGLWLEKYERSNKLFKGLESLMCDAALPDDLLTIFRNLTRLEYPSHRGKNAVYSFNEFCARKEKILSILEQKRRLQRDSFVIVFYGVLLDHEQQLDCPEAGPSIDQENRNVAASTSKFFQSFRKKVRSSLRKIRPDRFSTVVMATDKRREQREDEKQFGFTEFLVNNYDRLTSDRLGCIDYIDYSSLASYLVSRRRELSNDFANKCASLRIVKITNAVENPEKLLAFLGALHMPITLDTIDARLDAANFYYPLAQVAVVKKLNIVHTEPIDLPNMDDFNFLLDYNALKRLHTDQVLGLEVIEQYARKFNKNAFIITCKFDFADARREIEFGRGKYSFYFEDQDAICLTMSSLKLYLNTPSSEQAKLFEDNPCTIIEKDEDYDPPQNRWLHKFNSQTSLAYFTLSNM